MRALSILFGAAFTVATAFALGSLLLRWTAARFSRLESTLLSYILGSACHSAIVFALCATHVARKGVFLAVGIAGIAAAWRWRSVAAPEAVPPLSRHWRWAFTATFAVFSVYYFFTAMAPEVSPDGSAYHLGIVDHYNRAHGFERVSTNIYFNMPQGLELLFLMAFAFGKHSAAALVHFAFLATLPWLILAYGQRIGFPVAGAAAGLIVYTLPVIGITGSTAYVDVGLTAVLFALVFLLEIWRHAQNPRLLYCAGILAGFAFGIKYTAFLGTIYLCGFVLFTLARQPRHLIRPLLIACAMVTIVAAPWLIKNWIWVHNPVAPFANRIFPNPWIHVSFEEDYRRALSDYGLKSRSEILPELLLHGASLGGILGPVSILLPIALLGAMWRRGRQWLIPGLLFSLPWIANIGTRFLIPGIPFVALALILVLAKIRWLPEVITAAAVISCLPPVVGLYCGPGVWRIGDVPPVRAALRLQPEEDYLRANLAGYDADRLIEASVPRGESVFSFGGVPLAYTSRNVLVGFLSAPNEVLRDILLKPVVLGYQPVVNLDFRFPSRNIKRLRMVQRQSSGGEMWGMAELHVLHRGTELKRDPQWRLTAKPNPWEVQLAFDNSPVTRWRSWQPARAGDFVEIDFGSPREVDEVRIDCSDDYSNKQVRIEGIAADPTESHRAIEWNLRRAAIDEMKTRGVRYLLANEGDLGAADFERNARLWGLRRLGEAGGAHLYLAK